MQEGTSNRQEGAAEIVVNQGAWLGSKAFTFKYCSNARGLSKVHIYIPGGIEYHVNVTFQKKKNTNLNTSRRER